MSARPPRLAAPLLGVLLLLGCDRGEPGRAPAPAGPVDVRVSTPALLPGAIVVPGTVRSTAEAEVATRATGIIRRVEVEIGALVEAGDVLARLDPSDATAGVERAAAEAERAAAYYRRIASLSVDGAATPQELDDARTRRDAAEASLREARAQMAYVEIRAPFAGVVAARHADPGDLAMPGMPILSLVRPGSLKVEADVPARAAEGLAPGDSVLVRLGDGAGVAGRVARVSPVLDPGSRRARVEVTLGDGAAGPPVAPGSFARIEIPDPERSTLWVPADAAVRRGQLTGLYTIEEDRLRLRWVRPGEGREGALEILAGLGQQDAVVRDPDDGLADGAAVGDVVPVEWSP